MKSILGLIILCFGAVGSAAPQARPGFTWDAVRLMAVQDRGRFKPLETFANESLLYLTGKRKWNGLQPTEVLFGLLVAYDTEWESEPFLRVDYGPLKKELGLPSEKNFFSPKELMDIPALQRLASEVMQKEQRKEKLTETDKKLRQLINQKNLLEAVVGGQALAILPHPGGLTQGWFGISALTERESLPYGPEKSNRLADLVKEMLESFGQKDSGKWNKATNDLALYLRNDLVDPGAYPQMKDLQRESHYNHLRPFRWAWIFYTVAFVLLVSFLVTNRKGLLYSGLGAVAGGFGVHAYGFVIRMLISGRPPVTNMYESVIWVSWGCMLFALIVYASYRNAIIPAAASVFSVVALVLADNLPSVLDPGIHPLEPVLRSNYWLTIHVLTITLSYAAFAVSLCLGNVVLGNLLVRPTHTAKTQEYTLYMYRAMQIGVILLAVGTILGGIWADYSWGRFWGWDPKEVWALVALLLYLAVLHGRFTGWLRGFGFATAAVMSFLGVLMAWYGVNFVLGVGLHSYGFGTGGLFWVSLYILVQLGFIAASWFRYSKAKSQHSLDSSIFPKGSGTNG